MATPGSGDLLADALAHAAHLLPAQGPITVFIHHNTLHAFEDRPFETAIVEAGRLFGCEPLMSEERYRRELGRGRIRRDDLTWALELNLGATRGELVAGLASRRDLRLALLEHGLIAARGAELSWLLTETESVTAHPALWSASLRAAELAQPPSPPPRVLPVRHRDILLARAGVDSDDLVHPLLIRLSAAFLDQGVAYWPMPERELGIYRCFLRLYGDPAVPPPEHWLRVLRSLIEDDREVGRSECDSIRHSLAELGVAEDEWQPFITATALALRGWAGLMHQIEVRPDRVPVFAPPATLAAFVAVRLLLERAALIHLCGEHAPGLALRDLRTTMGAALSARPAPSAEERAWPVFQLAKILGRTAAELDRLSASAAEELFAEIAAFGELPRRRIHHLAYEHRYRCDILDALALHSPREPASAPSFQAVFCLDEREESLRRHLEEVDPTCETFGSAGFFGVAMYYRGVADAHARPLCPIVIKPRHEIEEVALDPERDLLELQRQSRRVVGRLTHRMGHGSRTLVRGTLVTGVLGALAAVPLVLRVLFPRFTARMRRHSFALIGPPRRTRLALEHRDNAKPILGEAVGFDHDEMADIVFRLLSETGLSRRLAPLVLVIGHRSSSLNNPHESAYDCGACGGGHGGPNARAFAQMANTPAVRSRLAARGLGIPPGTWFLGGEHNSCDDSLALFDLDLLPQELRADLSRVRDVFAEVRRRNAHERCRRFESAPPAWLPDELALAHVEARSEDLAQPRPECGHATNAVCVVGRRSRTRGLFLDRRAFLVSYDPTRDDGEATTLARLLAQVVPVVAGINLEYLFSYVDPAGYGCATKLPHNITGMLGVMDGASSDLRTGLPWQMVEIHEPMRLLVVVEAPPTALSSILAANPALGRLAHNFWIQLAALDPDSGAISELGPDGFSPYRPERGSLPQVRRSLDWYKGEIDHLPAALLTGEERER